MEQVWVAYIGYVDSFGWSELLVTLLTSIGIRYSRNNDPIWDLEDSNVEMAVDSGDWRDLGT